MDLLPDVLVQIHRDLCVRVAQQVRHDLDVDARLKVLASPRCGEDRGT
jgi:hypothetical protein